MTKQNSQLVTWYANSDNEDTFYQSLVDAFGAGVSRTGNTFLIDNDFMNCKFEFYYLQDSITLIKATGFARQLIHVRSNRTPNGEHYFMIFTLNKNALLHQYPGTEIEILFGLESLNNISYSTFDVPYFVKLLPREESSTLFLHIPVSLLDKKMFLLPQSEGVSNNYEVSPIKGYASMDAKMIELVNDIFHNDCPEDIEPIYLKGIVFQLMALLIKTVEKQNRKLIHETDVQEAARMVQIKNLLVDDFSKPCPAIKDMAKAACMSETKFKSTFKKLFKMSYYQYYQHTRLMAAKNLLGIGMSVKDVAFAVGFSDAANFSTAFKNKFDKAPSDVTDN